MVKYRSIIFADDRCEGTLRPWLHHTRFIFYKNCNLSLNFRVSNETMSTSCFGIFQFTVMCTEGCIDDGYPLMWMRFSTLVFLFCLKKKFVVFLKTRLFIQVYSNASKRKEGSSHHLLESNRH